MKDAFLQPEYYAMDTVMVELVRQVGMQCKERGELLEMCRKKFIDCFSTVALCLQALSARDQKALFEERKVNGSPYLLCLFFLYSVDQKAFYQEREVND